MTSALRILISGSTGLVGRALVPALRGQGHEVVRLVRLKEGASVPSDAIAWDPTQTLLPQERLEGFDAVIHLAGENIAGGRWTKKKKERLFISRCRDTWVLAAALARLKAPPKRMLCASAIGFYGDRGHERLTEESGKGKGFLPDLCEQWEKACEPVRARGTQVVHLRFGIVLSPLGGMLAKMLPLFRWGLGARVGSGKQIVSWVALEDVVGVIGYLLQPGSPSGAVNVAAPHSLSQIEFADTLARHLKRRAWLVLPAWLLRLFLGEMADELLLSSADAVPEKLLASGYRFRFTHFSAALMAMTFSWNKK